MSHTFALKMCDSCVTSEHVRALQSSDAWVCVGSSIDVLPLRNLVSDLKIILPESGSSIWADFFVTPSKTNDAFDGPSPMVNPWLDYVLSPARSESK